MAEAENNDRLCIKNNLQFEKKNLFAKTKFDEYTGIFSFFLKNQQIKMV